MEEPCFVLDPAGERRGDRHPDQISPVKTSFFRGEAILHIYKEGLDDSLILGVFREENFCGLSEIYGYKASLHKVSVGYRLLKEEWGKGLATKALKLMVQELFTNRGIKSITASVMVQNTASAHVLQKNGFTLLDHAATEDWGFPSPTLADKWMLIRKPE